MKEGKLCRRGNFSMSGKFLPFWLHKKGFISRFANEREETFCFKVFPTRDMPDTNSSSLPLALVHFRLISRCWAVRGFRFKNSP